MMIKKNERVGCECMSEMRIMKTSKEEIRHDLEGLVIDGKILNKFSMKRAEFYGPLPPPMQVWIEITTIRIGSSIRCL
jgi:hypothetical protein